MSALALMSATVLACAPAQDEHGHTFATCFNPWKGIGLAGSFDLSNGAPGAAFNTGFRLRTEGDSKSKTDSTWHALYEIGATQVRPVDSQVAVEVTAFNALFRRHVREGVLLLPFNPPVQIPFPLDMAFHTSVARYERRLSEGDDWSFEPVRLSVLFDPLRSASSRFHLGIGFTAAYRLRQVSQQLVHEVTPLTAGTIVFSFESEEGLWFARGALTAGGSFTVSNPTLAFKARGEVELSRVVFAVADQPIAVFVRGSAAWRDAGARETSEYSVQAGLSLRLFSSR
ncbi:MAG: hypothetical protein ACO1OB_01830 [Archangium sp.]